MNIQIIIGLISKINMSRWVFLCAHWFKVHPPSSFSFFFFCFVLFKILWLKCGRRYLTQKGIVLPWCTIAGNWCTTDTTLKPPIFPLRTTRSYTADCHTSQCGGFFKQKFVFRIIFLFIFFPTSAFHTINRWPRTLAAQKLVIIFTWETNFSVGCFFCILCILSAVFLCYSY